MKISYDTRTAAQALAARLHQHAIDTMPDYAESAKLGHTLRWCVPFQEVDSDGNVVDDRWHVVIDDRVAGGLTDREREAVPELKAADDAAAPLDEMRPA